MQSAFQFIPKMFTGVEVRALTISTTFGDSIVIPAKQNILWEFFRHGMGCFVFNKYLVFFDRISKQEVIIYPSDSFMFLHGETCLEI